MSKSSCAMFKNLPTSKVLKQIARLNNIAGTPETAYKFDPKYKKIELLLIQKSVHGPSIGLKKFWRQHLPTLKFHNDDINFTLTRIHTETKEDLKKCPAKIIVYDEANQKIELECANKQASDILNELVKLTSAQPVPETQIPTIRAPQYN